MKFVIPWFIVVSVCALNVQAAPIFVPNGSFESPETDFAVPEMDGWQKAPQPAWYNDPMFPWPFLMGQFHNTPEGSADHIDNMDRQQGAFLFALPGVGIFQDYNSLAGSAPSREFNAQFEAGKSYTLTVGVLGGGGGMSNGATFEISLYYRDRASNIVTIAATTITNTDELFPTNTHFIDFQVRMPRVQASDAWAGKRIGIQLASTVAFDLMGGYWDIDNVRLTDSVVPNHSFESPPTDFASPLMDNWEKAPQPAWYNDPFFPWPFLMGQFQNTSNGSPDHIDNIEGRQGAFLFALPEVAIFQDYNTIGSTSLAPTHEFDAKFEAGKSYALTAAILGGSGGMSNGATLEISLYYRDAASNFVTVGSTTITNTDELFPTNTHLLDFQARVPQVNANDAWVGKNIGIRLASTTAPDLASGYWDIDNVRLTESVLPNNSFESPDTDFASPLMDAWEKSPQPAWYNDPMFPWFTVMGQFANTPPGSANYIENMDGEQGAYMFALPDAAIFQDLDVNYEAGNSYNLVAGVLGGGGGMSNGATFQISFYYRDAASNKVTIASTTITNSDTLFPTNTYFIDFQAQVPAVNGREAWAGKNIGVQLASTVGFDLMGGYWDVDNLRLSIVRDPVFKDPLVIGDQFHLSLHAAPGRYEVLSSSDLSNWTSVGIVTNETGSVTMTITTSAKRFYKARTAP